MQQPSKLTELRSIAMEAGQKPANTGESGSSLLVIGLVVFFATLAITLAGGLGWRAINDGKAVDFHKAAIQAWNSIGEPSAFDLAYNSCDRGSGRKAKSGDGLFGNAVSNFQKANDENRVAGIIQCLAGRSTERFCDAGFRSDYINLVQKHYSFGAVKSGGMAFGFGGSKNGSSRPPAMSKAQRRIHGSVAGLLSSGYLQRSDFSSILFGDPQWLKDMMGERVLPPRPCSGRA